MAGWVLVRRGEAGAERDVVGAGAVLHGLVTVVADRVVLGEVAQDRGVALRHVVEAHLHGALVDRGGRGWAGIVTRWFGHPWGGRGVGGGGFVAHVVESGGGGRAGRSQPDDTAVLA